MQPSAPHSLTGNDAQPAYNVSSALDELNAAGLAAPGKPLRLHLGCGETLLEEYVNIDYPPTEHNVMTVTPDVYADIVTMDFPAGSVDEIRLHHVFEHFSRVTALAMLIKWHQWLKVGGKLHIETPDLVGCAKNILGSSDFTVKMGNVRHLAGDQAASWAYHVDHWFEERYQRTLSVLGFDPVRTSSSHWEQSPYLWNVEAIATKSQTLSMEELLRRADQLLWDSTVSPKERPTYEVWCRQLREVLNGQAGPKAANVTPAVQPQPRAPENAPAVEGFAPEVVEFAQRLWDVIRPKEVVSKIAEVRDFNQAERNRWVANKAATIPSGASVLDIGAGTCPYRDLFAHCVYKTHDFKQYEGEKLGGTSEYGHIDYVSDVTAIPVPDNSFDVILCTEVLEHVPEPVAALKEMARIIKPGGRLFITAPLGSGLHQLPYHFYGGYTPYWYEHFCEKFGLEAVEITPNGGFFKLLSQETARSAKSIVEALDLDKDKAEVIQKFFGEVLPTRFYELDEQLPIERFTVGYFVEAAKPMPGVPVPDNKLRGIERRLRVDPHDATALVDAIVLLIEKKRFAEARAYAERANQLCPNNEVLTRLLSELSRV